MKIIGAALCVIALAALGVDFVIGESGARAVRRALLGTAVVTATLGILALANWTGEW